MWQNTFVKLLLRSPLHGLGSGGLLLITYTGHKSGRQYTVPVNYMRDDDLLRTTSFKHRTWWRSLRGGVPVLLRLRGRDVLATATVLEDETAVAADLRLYLRRFPRLAPHFQVTLDENLEPDPAGLAAAAAKRVIVRMRLDA